MYNELVLIFYKPKEAFFFMKFLKRAAALLLSFSMLTGVSGCGEDTAYAMNVDGMDVRAGLYLYYATNAYQDAMDVLEKNGVNFSEMKESSEIAAELKKSNIDGKTVEEWIQNKAELYCAEYVAVEKEFEAQGLSLTGQQIAQVNDSAVGSQDYFGEFFENTGIGLESVKDITRSGFKQSALWDKYYGEGGIKDIQTQTLYDDYAKNHLRLKYITMPLKDGEGNLLKADGKDELRKMAEDYLARLAKKQDDEAALMKEMDFLIDEHNTYVTSLSEAAVTTTDESGNTITTPTTAKLTTDEFGNTATTTLETTTDENGETNATTAGTTADENETTEPAETTTAEADDENGETTTAAGTEATTTTTEETTTTTVSTTYDKSKEKILAVSTTAKDEGSSAAETTAAPTYTPCELVYNWVLKDDAPLLKPELIEDEECWYIVIKMDIKDRMTSDDLWTSSQIESTRQSLYYQDFQDLMEEWANNLTVTRNNKAFRRYKVLDLDIKGYQSALMQSYYAMYSSGGYGY